MQVMEKLTEEVRWNLSPLGNGDDDPVFTEEQEIIKKHADQFVQKWKERRDYVQNPEVLRESLDEYEYLHSHYGTSGKEGYYFWLRTMQDQNNAALKARYQKIHDFSIQLENELQFFRLNVGKVSEKNQTLFLEFPGLLPYKHFLKMLFREAKHHLSEPEEKILNFKTQTSYEKWIKMVSGFLAKEEQEVLTEQGTREKKSFSEVKGLIDSTNKEVRDDAAKKLNEILKKHSDSAEEEINAILTDKKVNDELRKFVRPDSARHLSDDIESEVVDILVKSVRKNFDIPQRFYALKAKIFGVPKLEYHERNVPFGKIDKSYSYEEAFALTAGVFEKLDPEFSSIVKGFRNHGWIDVYPKAGKKDGAFCVYWLKSQPTYILLNHLGKLRDVTTMAHEFGHGINNELIKKKQNSLNFGTPLSTAEVASTFMEDFVLEELMRGADDELKFSIMISKLQDDISTIFRQIACYCFEQELHKEFRNKGYLPKEEIGSIFQRHMEEYMGESVEQSAGSENWWVYWSHIRSFFYVYSYASGLLISKFLQSSVRKNPNFINKVKEFLSAGTSDSPKNIFYGLGIDITQKEFWEQGLNEIENLLRECEVLARKLGKLK